MMTLIHHSIRWFKETLTSTDPLDQTILRIIVAVFGGYALTATFLAALSLVLPWPKADILFFSLLFPPLTYLAAVLWAFAAPTALRAWRDLSMATLANGIVAICATWIR
jgi:hypothetical protein